MEFLTGLFAGLLLWPWWGLGLFFILCLIDAVLVENNIEGWAVYNSISDAVFADFEK